MSPFRSVTAGLAGGVLAGVMLLGGCAGPMTRAVGPEPVDPLLAEETVSEAESLLAAGQAAAAASLLKALPGPIADGELAARAYFLEGRAYLTGAEAALQERSAAGNAMGLLPGPVAAALSRARDSLLLAADTDPHAAFAPRALFLAARTMDHGYLQDFPRAMEIYQWTAAAYPGSEYGQMAADRYRELDRILGGVKGTRHRE